MEDGRCMMEDVPRSGISLWLRRWLMGNVLRIGLHNFIITHPERSRGKSLIYCYLFVALVFITNISTAQSIDSLVNEAVRNNPQLKSLQYKITAAERRSESVNTMPPPSFSVEFSQVPINTLNVLNKSVSNNFSLSQMFPIGGKLNAMSEVERQNMKVEGNNYESYKTNLIAQLKMSYYNLWLLDRKIEIQQKQIELLNNLIRSVESVYITNRINQADLLTLQSEIASGETQILTLQNQKSTEIYKLNKLLGRELNSKDIYAEKEIASDSLIIPQSKLEEILTEENPSLKKMNSMIDMNKAMIDANNRELIPDLMVQGMLMRMPRGMLLTSKTDPMMIDGKGETELMYGIMASINLPFAPWSANKFKAKEEELYAGISSFEYEKEDMRRDMISKLNESILKYKTALDLIKLYNEKVIPLNEKAIEAQTSAFQNNRTSVTTIIDSYRMLLMQQMNYYMARADSRMAIAEIEMMIGTNLITGR
ncbi:MAG: TolC family protein [Ignavibacteriales bacterium]|nr:MAG: TolC family protein [Ignavibacteriales bacterium]